ncbi:hypothetical protein CYLTODRAFT_444006 [Cylindrobasidium torrendii FP15055 ss-10]|uniref:Uncharacterized protein n=1 Tax=Cylindrobasidium torrendii FP15055 ss-10 TaxID=1314674 RepID=A0A0D7BD50_9AGAR|nr:hypothetical protein CYLTODRAFT_444006 [Cylindrobasidium torrendii FP15055 ss-10]
MRTASIAQAAVSHRNTVPQVQSSKAIISIHEYHRKVLATIIKKRAVIDHWRRNVSPTPRLQHCQRPAKPMPQTVPVAGAARPAQINGGVLRKAASQNPDRPPPRPTYQGRLSDEFFDLYSALPKEIRPSNPHDRVAVMSRASSYIMHLKNSLHELLGEPSEETPDYLEPVVDQELTAMQIKTLKENTMLKYMSDLLPRISVMPSKIQWIEHATGTIELLEAQYLDLINAAKKARGTVADDAISIHSSSASTPPPTHSGPSSQAGNSAAYSCPATPNDEVIPSFAEDVEIRSTGSGSNHSEGRLPSIRDILTTTSDDGNLKLPPLRWGRC